MSDQDQDQDSPPVEASSANPVSGDLLTPDEGLEPPAHETPPELRTGEDGLRYAYSPPKLVVPEGRAAGQLY